MVTVGTNASMGNGRGDWINIPRDRILSFSIRRNDDMPIKTIIAPLPWRTTQRITLVIEHAYTHGFDSMDSFDEDLGWLPRLREANDWELWDELTLHWWIAMCCHDAAVEVVKRAPHHRLWEDHFAQTFPKVVYTYAPGFTIDQSTFIRGEHGVHPTWGPDIKIILTEIAEALNY